MLGVKYSIIIMVIGSFLTQYFVMSYMTTNNIKNVKNSLGKFYISASMACFMGILEVAMYDYSLMKFRIRYYLPLIFLTILFLYLYRNQVYIDDKQYLSGMIEHHSMAILTSEELLKKTHDYNVAKIAKDIIQKQNDEIVKMKSIIERK